MTQNMFVVESIVCNYFSFDKIIPIPNPYLVWQNFGFQKKITKERGRYYAAPVVTLVSVPAAGSMWTWRVASQ